MYSAIVLVCAGSVINLDTCVATVSPVFFKTLNECNQTVEALVERDLFKVVDQNGKTYNAVAHRCIGWTDKQV